MAYWIGRTVQRYGGFSWRWLLIGGVLGLLTPAAPRLLPTPSQHVSTQHPQTCVHTRLTDEVEDWKVQRSLSMVREMGAPTIVEFFPWAYIQPSAHEFDWHHPDRIISMAEHEGIQVIARLGIVPAWARPPVRVRETSLNYLTADHYADYARFVAVFAARYAGRVVAIIPWNEPNLSYEWGDQPVVPENYVALLKQVSTAVRAVAPRVLILGGALAPTLESGGRALNELDYWEQVYQDGGAPYFDGVAIHTYGFTWSADDSPRRDKLNFRRFELLMQIMAHHGDAAKPVYITEAGWNDHPRWVNAVRSGARVTNTLDALRLVETKWPTVKTLCFWYFRYPTAYRSYMDYFAFVTPEFRPKPIYTAVQTYARGWDDRPQ